MRIEDMDYVIDPNTGEKIDMNKLLKEQRYAKTALCNKFPFFNILADKLTPIYTWRVNTQATDGTRLFINPAFTNKLTLQQKVFVMAHEIMHCALDHMNRAKMSGHNHERSNIAGDYEINGLLVADNLVDDATIKAIGALLDHKYDGMGYEHIYALNPKAGNQDNSKNSSNEKITYDADYIRGWEQAIKDYLSGKITI